MIASDRELSHFSSFGFLKRVLIVQIYLIIVVIYLYKDIGLGTLHSLCFLPATHNNLTRHGLGLKVNLICKFVEWGKKNKVSIARCGLPESSKGRVVCSLATPWLLLSLNCCSLQHFLLCNSAVQYRMHYLLKSMHLWMQKTRAQWQ